ncbi:MAG: hypothetical protein C4541_11580 [Candidatus Auribacter fodinae]|uniref:Uncharacterized protein n=1 Tax=Candidatus Auribacter fodinae TaxID=2093366 RepID=A0A3A4QSF6_9BACT|nr:MAG: hypothetical protein C4541_11580 [Candidatus Auribacter fodinae]
MFSVIPSHALVIVAAFNEVGVSECVNNQVYVSYFRVFGGDVIPALVAQVYDSFALVNDCEYKGHSTRKTVVVKEHNERTGRIFSVGDEKFAESVEISEKSVF